MTRTPSHRLPPWRRLAAVAGIWALLLAALLPVHGLAAPAGGGVPVCTAGGIVYLSLDGGASAPAPGADRAGAACPFCLMHGAALAPPARIAVPLPMVWRPVAFVVPAVVAAARAKPGRAHLSRAPPVAA